MTRGGGGGVARLRDRVQSADYFAKETLRGSGPNQKKGH